MSQNSEAGGDSMKAKLAAFLAKSAMGSEMKEKVRKFVLLSAEHGFTTVQNLAECIPDSQVDPVMIEEIMNILDALDIKLLDEDEAEFYRRKVEEAEAKSAKKPRSFDPLDRYNAFFTKLRYKPLLKSAEINELAKRIEESEQGALDSLFSCGLTLPFQIELGLKLLRRDEPLAKLVAIKKVESLEAYFRMLPRTTEECTKLKAKLDKAWQKYLDEPDREKKSLARQAYRKMELATHDGCKALLRKFCFKAKIFRAWLEEPEIKADIEDADRIVDALSASSIQASPAPAGWQVVYVNRGRDIERRRRLSPPDLAYLARDVRAQLAEAEKAREELLKSHAPLVSLIAESYQDRGVPLAELIEAGNDSLRETSEGYDYRNGVHFAHHVSSDIRPALLSLIAKKAGIGSVALDDLEFIEIIPEVHKELKDELGRDPLIEELANEMNIAIDVVPKLLKVPGLDGLSFLNKSKAPSSDDPLRAQIGKILDALEQREREVMILRFGLLDGEMHRRQDIALFLKISPDEVEAIETSALIKLRSMSRSLGSNSPFGDRLT
jgi:RNA polymerase primary sigma factor